MRSGDVFFVVAYDYAEKDELRLVFEREVPSADAALELALRLAPRYAGVAARRLPSGGRYIECLYDQGETIEPEDNEVDWIDGEPVPWDLAGELARHARPG